VNPTPTVIQFDGVECGPAALAMVLAHHGRPVPLHELCAACDVERFGSRADRLVATARHYGLDGRGFRVSLDDARRLAVPFIAHWQADHFVVVEAFDAGHVTINDPACGRRVLAEADFEDAFSGVVLTFEPDRWGSRRATPGGERADDDALVAALRNEVRGAVGWLPRHLDRFSEDFSRVTRQRPRLVVKAVCEEDISRTLRLAQRGVVTKPETPRRSWE
jgi:hypothetical protein